jgi:transcriptional regulator with XRE-family HTH domain
MPLTLSELQTHDEVLAEELQDPAFRAEWDRLTLARAVGRWVLNYRLRNSLSQRRLAAILGIKQPQVARLEAGGHDPSMNTLRLLSDRLGAEFLVVISPPQVQPRWGRSRPPHATLFEDAELSTGTHITVAAR